MNMLSPHHFVLDGYGGYRSRYDDTSLIYELLDELPAALNLTPAMPPIVLPYYNGVTPDDCGISAFVILNGGHMTLHTFSFRECFFADILAPQAFDAEAVEKICNRTLPATQVATQMIDRDSDDLDTNGRSEADFGPHLMMEVEGYCGPDSMDDLFALFEAGRFDAAKAAFERRLETRPNDPEALYYLGRLSSSGALSRRFFERLLVVHPKHALADDS